MALKDITATGEDVRALGVVERAVRYRLVDCDESGLLPVSQGFLEWEHYRIQRKDGDFIGREARHRTFTVTGKMVFQTPRSQFHLKIHDYVTKWFKVKGVYVSFLWNRQWTPQSLELHIEGVYEKDLVVPIDLTFNKTSLARPCLLGDEQSYGYLLSEWREEKYGKKATRRK